MRALQKISIFAALAFLLLSSCRPLFAQAPGTSPLPASPQSTHYPILLLAFGSEPAWSVRIGQKGPERFDRQGYPPITLEPADVSSEGTGQGWIYRAKDSGTGAQFSLHLTRTSCSQGNPESKYGFRVIVEHAQIGTLNGCARIATELFPKIINQPEADDDAEKKKPPVATVINFQSPVAVAYLNSAGKVIVGHGQQKKIVAPAGADLALSHDGKKLLYTRPGPRPDADRTIVLYDITTGRSTDLITGNVRQPFWSPDDSRIAFLKLVDSSMQIWSVLVTAPEQPALLYTGPVTNLHGWLDDHDVLASDSQLSWIGDDGKVRQSISLKDLYGDAFVPLDSDTIRVNPANPDLLLVSLNDPPNAASSPNIAHHAATGFFLYEVRAKRRVLLSPPGASVHSAEWSRDGLQIFFTHVIGSSSAIDRIFWDGTGGRKYLAGSDLVVGQ